VELRDYLRAARRRWLLLIGTAVVLVAVAAGVMTQITPQYQSTSGLFITTTSPSANNAYQGSLFSQNSMNSVAAMATGSNVARGVIHELRLHTTPAKLEKQIHASAVPATAVLQVDVRDANRVQAKRINGAVLQQLQRLVRHLETPPGRKTALLKATVVNAPHASTNPVFPNRILFLGVALVVGLLLGFGLAIMRDVMVTDREIEKAFEDDEARHRVPAARAQTTEV
jgi:capsular polysaccharide biosynthesis protein